MTIKTTIINTAAVVAALPAISMAHPGHEPDDFLHAIAHELMTPRGIAAVLLIGAVATGVYLWARSKR